MKDVEQTQTEEQEQEQEHREMLLNVMKDRQKIADKINGKAISDAFITIVQRAEMHSMVQGKDYYITTVENGIAFFPEEEYEKLVEKTIFDLRKYLATKNLSDADIEKEVDAYAANLVIHYVDFKSFTDEEVQACRKRFGVAPTASAAPEENIE